MTGLFHVLILPMRNGNPESFDEIVYGIDFVLILPMRNGNVTFSTNIVLFACSYPTYEEWKPKYSVNNRFPLKMFLSYL